MSEQDLTPDQLEQLREQLASVSAGDVVAEAAMSLIALAYVRLGITPAPGAGGLGHPAPAQRAVGPGPGLAAPATRKAPPW